MRKHRILLKRLENFSTINEEFDIESLKSEKYLYVHLAEHFGEFKNSTIKGRIRESVFKFLLKIYDIWKIELEKLKKPYYLAIWINESELMLSQIVCGIDERIEFYKKNKYFNEQPCKDLELNLNQFGKLKSDFQDFNWLSVTNFKRYDNVDYNFPKENYVDVEDYYKDKRFYKRVLPKCEKVEDGKYGKVYFREFGKIWIGQKNIC
jgi:hypothetical protein